MRNKGPADDLIKRVQKEAVQKSDSLQSKPLDKPMPQAPYELWPGENYELGGWALARAKKKRNLRRAVYGKEGLA